MAGVLQLYCAAAQTTSAGDWLALTWDAVTAVDATTFTFSDGGSEVTINQAGYYFVTCDYAVNGTAGPTGELRLQHHDGVGWNDVTGAITRFDLAGANAAPGVTGVLNCKAGDKVRAQLRRQAGVTNLTTLANIGTLCLVWLEHTNST